MQGTAGTSGAGGKGGTSSTGGKGGTTSTAGKGGTSSTAGKETGGTETGGTETGGTTSGGTTSGGTSGTAGTSTEGGAGGETTVPPEGGMGGALYTTDGGAGGQGGGGDGGAGGETAVSCGAPTPSVLRDFSSDPGGALDKYLTPATGPLADNSVLSYDTVEGSPTAGSAKLVAAFSAFGDKAQISNYYWPDDWSCKTKFHAMVKLVSATDLTHVKDIQFSMNSGGYVQYTGVTINTSTFVSDTWYQIDLDVTTAYNSPDPLPTLDAIDNIAIQVETVTSGTTPVSTTLYVDNIWAE